MSAQGALGPAAFGEAFLPVGAYGFEHVQTCLACRVDPGEQGLVHQSGHGFESLDG